jgi:hypothetical protein
MGNCSISSCGDGSFLMNSICIAIILFPPASSFGRAGLLAVNTRIIAYYIIDLAFVNIFRAKGQFYGLPDEKH